MVDAATVPAGFLAAHRVLRSGRPDAERVALAIGAAPAAIAAAVALAFLNRLRVDGTYHQVTERFGTRPVAGGPLGWAVLWMGAMIVGGRRDRRAGPHGAPACAGGARGAGPGREGAGAAAQAEAAVSRLRSAARRGHATVRPDRPARRDSVPTTTCAARSEPRYRIARAILQPHLGARLGPAFGTARVSKRTESPARQQGGEALHPSIPEIPHHPLANSLLSERTRLGQGGEAEAGY